MAFTPILSSKLAHATGKTRALYDIDIFFNSFRDSPDGIKRGEPLLDGIRRPRRLPVGISNAHRGWQLFSKYLDNFVRWERVE